MAVNNLPNVAQLMETGANQIQVEESVRVQALQSTQRMLEFARQRTNPERVPSID